MNPTGLDDKLKDLMSAMRKIKKLMTEINEQYGVKFISAQVWNGWYSSGSILLSRGIDEAAEALGDKAEIKNEFCTSLHKEFKHYGIDFSQHPQTNTTHFLKAFESKKETEIV